MAIHRRVLILGGARSGKSRTALRLAESTSPERTYIATAQAFDDEMRERIDRHRAERDGSWQTVDAPLDLVEAVQAQVAPRHAVLVDCLTLWLSNLMLEVRDVVAESDGLMDALPQLAGPVVFVANEVGLGIVPDNALARAFRDHAGRLNQRIAEIANSVFFVAAGLPLRLK